MYWNNGTFYENVTIYGKLYTSDHKHLAISGNKNGTIFGESGAKTFLRGNGIDINSVDTINSASTNETTISSINQSVNLKASKYVNLNGTSGITVSSSSYGTTLPSTGTEGQVFFKLIS